MYFDRFEQNTRFIFGMGNGRRGRGRPRRRWMDEVVETTGLRIRQLTESARLCSRQFAEGGVERCCQSRHQGTSASQWNKPCWEWFEIIWFEIVIWNYFNDLRFWFEITFTTVILILIWNNFLGDFDLILWGFLVSKSLWRRSTLYFVHVAVIMSAYSLNESTSRTVALQH